jgi:hypothetical protein
VAAIPAGVWAPAFDGRQGPGRAWVAEATGLLDLTGLPTGMRVIVRKERPHPGAQLRIIDADGPRITAFTTDTGRGRSPTWNCGTDAGPAARTGSAP